MLEVKHIGKIYKTEEKNNVVALDDINLSFQNTGLVFILGLSGSGKTTLLNLIGGIDQKTEGEILLDGKEITAFSLEEYRRNVVSFVFQEFNLLYNLNVYDNVSLVSFAKDKEQKDKVVHDILSSVNLVGYEHRRIQELSGGQKQRIAIGRALAKGCEILLCDEPTGNLDSTASIEVFDLLKEISKEKLVIVVSHNSEMAEKYADRILSIRDGKIEDDRMIHEIPFEEKEKKKKKEKNHVSFSSIFNYAFSSLFSSPLKTMVSTALLILSLLSICCMVIFLTYSSEHIISISSKADSIEYIVHNTGSDEQPNALYYGLKLGNINATMFKDNLMEGYSIQNTTFYVVNDKNKSILDNYSYYFREDLDQSSCYVTDYYVRYVLSSDNKYKIEDFSSLEDLKNTDVYFNEVFQYKIAGIIQTDYSRFYDERGNIKEYSSMYSDYRDYMADFMMKSYYEYNVIFGNHETFEGISYGNSRLNFYSSSCNIEVKNKEYVGKLSSLTLECIGEKSSVDFFLEDGHFGSVSKEDSYTKKISMKQSEIVVSPYLYDFIFGTRTNWDDVYLEYRDGMNQDSLVNGILSHLGEVVSFSVIIDEKTIEISNVTIIGVSTEYYSEEKINFTIYGLEHMGGISNSSLTYSVVGIADWTKVANKKKMLDSLRDNNIVLAGAKYNIAYSMEYQFKMMSLFFTGLAAILGLIACFSVINLVNHRIRDNKKPIGILYASGCRKHEIIFMYLIPVMIITLLSLVLSIFLTLIGCIILNKIISHSGVGYVPLLHINYQTILVLFSFGILVILLSFITLKRYLDKNPMDIIR